MRTLIAHDDEAYEEWGASASVRIDPDSDGRGMSLSITPTWGSAAGEAEQLWSARDPNGLAGNDDFEAKSRLDVELGYGLRAPQGFGLVTPYAELAITDGANRTLRTGLRWNASQSATLDLEATREENGTGHRTSEHRHAPRRSPLLSCPRRWRRRFPVGESEQVERGPERGRGVPHRSVVASRASFRTRHAVVRPARGPSALWVRP